MSLTTRCPACSTTFKVVADQLKVSGGWVRCGHCAEVFDAQAYLQKDVPVDPQGELPVGAPAQVPLAQVPDSGYPSEINSEVPSELMSALPSELPSQVPSEWAPEWRSLPGSLPLREAGAAQPDSLLQDSLAPPDSVLERVSFVRKARAQAFWRRPLVRACLGLAALLFTALLVGQVAYVERDRIAAVQPQARPALFALCQALGCTLQPLRQIDALVIDSSSFSKLRADAYRLSVVVKNTAAVELAMPSLDLALTDTQDVPVLRRILTPAELGAGPILVGGGEFTGSVAIQIDKTPVAGYRVIAFYP